MARPDEWLDLAATTDFIGVWRRVAGTLVPGSVITLRLAWDNHALAREYATLVCETIKDFIGHSQFVLLLFFDDDADVEVYGPEGMLDVLKTMSAVQLAKLAAL